MGNALEKRLLILETATKLFSRYGFSKTSLDDIAAAAQIAKGTVYYYFPSKEELFMAALELKSDEYFVTLSAHIDQAVGFEAKLTLFLHMPIKYIYENMPILIECLRNMPYNYMQRLEEFKVQNMMRMTQLLHEILVLGKEQGIISPEYDTDHLCEALIDWYLLGDTLFREMDMPKLLERIERDHELIIKTLLYGIVKRG